MLHAVLERDGRLARVAVHAEGDDWSRLAADAHGALTGELAR